ncbi:MAG: hypothetical protein K2X81_10655, partial [Candidatus Obscuribacterales bacterium]|nr:hypothetical protein [Candidatus Obscuribacterales bacterium]
MVDENKNPDESTNPDPNNQEEPDSKLQKKAKTAAKPWTKNKLLFWTWKVFSLCFLAFIGILSLLIVVGSSPILRAAISPIAILLEGTGYSLCDLSNPSQLSTKDHFSLEINSNRPSSYRLKIYKKNYDDFAKFLGDRITADEFNMSPYPPVSPENIRSLLWNKAALYEHSGDLQYVDYLKAKAIDTMGTTLPLGDYIYVLDQPQRDKNGTHCGVQVGTFRVSDLGLIVKKSEDKTLVKVFDVNTLAPVADAKVELLSHPTMEYYKTAVRNVTTSDG